MKRPHAPRLALPLAFALFAPLALGCASSSGSGSGAGVVPRFPSKGDLARIQTVPPRAEVFQPSARPVASWRLDATRKVTPLDELTREAGATPNEPSRCAAREIARFATAHQGTPSERLRRHIKGRCGIAAPQLQVAFMTVDAPASVPDHEVVTKLSPRLKELMGKAAFRGMDGAIVLHRDGDRGAFGMAFSRAEAEVAPLAPIGDQTTVVLRGTVRKGADGVTGMVNLGPTGFATCVPDASVKLPAFALSCPVAPGDRTTWASVIARRTGVVLQRTIADVLVVRDEAQDGDFSDAITDKAGAPGPAAFSAAIVRKLNEIRAGAKLGPLELVDAQSAENARVSGAFVGAAVGGDDASGDRIALGLLAGWEVPGTIRSGSFVTSFVSGTTDPAAWLASTLDAPLSRSVLLAPAPSRIAVGPVLAEGNRGVGALVTTYALYGSEGHAADVDHVLTRLARERAARGRQAPQRLRLAAMSAAIKSIDQGKDPHDALTGVLGGATEELGQGVVGFVVETVDPELIEFPDALLKGAALPIAVEITHRKTSDAAWGQLVVLIVVPSGSVTATAAAPRRARGG